MSCRLRGSRCARCFLLLVTLTASLAVGRTRAEGPTRVLFIGNSYTCFNNLPAIFAKLAAVGHQERVATHMLAPGGWRLADHWVNGDARKALHEEHRDFVVLQVQSTLGVSSFVDGIARVTSDRVFRPAAEQFVRAISEAGATPQNLVSTRRAVAGRPGSGRSASALARSPTSSLGRQARPG